MKNFKSYGFWTALSGAIVVLLNAIGKCFGFSVEEEIVSNVVMAIAGILVVFGVVSMPKKDKTDSQESDNEESTEVEEVGKTQPDNEEDENSESLE